MSITMAMGTWSPGPATLRAGTTRRVMRGSEVGPPWAWAAAGFAASSQVAPAIATVARTAHHRGQGFNRPETRAIVGEIMVNGAEGNRLRTLGRMRGDTRRGIVVFGRPSGAAMLALWLERFQPQGTVLVLVFRDPVPG